MIGMINREVDRGRVVLSRSSNTIPMFTEPKRDTSNEARLLLYCITRTVVTHKDNPPMSGIEQIIYCVGSRRFRHKLHLIDGCHNIKIHSESLKDCSFSCQMRKYDSLIIEQGDGNAPAPIMRAMNFLFRNIKDLRIYLDYIHITNHTYEEDINSIRALMKTAKDYKLWFINDMCQFMPARMQILRNILTDQGLDVDPDEIDHISKFPKAGNTSQL